MKFDSTLPYALRTLLNLIWVVFASIIAVFCLFAIPQGQGDALRRLLQYFLLICAGYTVITILVFCYRFQWATVKGSRIIFRCALFPLASIKLSDIRYVHVEKICAIRGRNPFRYLTEWLTIETNPDNKNLHRDSCYNAFGQPYQVLLASRFNVALLRQLYQEQTGGTLPLVPFY